MSNPFRGSAQLVGADATYNLHLDIEMMVALKRETGLPLKLMLQQLDLGDLELFGQIFWVAAQRHHPKLSISPIYSAMSDLGLEGMQATLEELFKNVMPKAKEGGSGGENPPKRARTTAKR